MVGGGHRLSLTLHQWINDALMAVFFLLVGLETKREALAGELVSARQAALLIAAAIGGMVSPRPSTFWQTAVEWKLEGGRFP